MTNQEAIETLKTNYPDACYEQLREAVDMAIEALQSQELNGTDTCVGCKHRGKWENEVEYGYNSPCTICRRRTNDNYEQ